MNKIEVKKTIGKKSMKLKASSLSDQQNRLTLSQTYQEKRERAQINKIINEKGDVTKDITETQKS